MEDMLARLRAASRPVSRTGNHASVLCLLYPSPSAPHDDLNVLLTLRASRMRSHAGDVSFPGGRQDPGEEGDPWRTAMREAEEEIGLPRTFPVDRIACFPPYLSKNELFVTPCVAFSATDPHDSWRPQPNEAEVDAVFVVRLSEILRPDKYDGRWMQWYEQAWRLHRFEVRNAADAPPPTLSTALRRGKVNETLHDDDHTFNLWGLTARIMVDVARTAFATTPPYEFVDEVGDTKRIEEVRKSRRQKVSVRGAL